MKRLTKKLGALAASLLLMIAAQFSTPAEAAAPFLIGTNRGSAGTVVITTTVACPAGSGVAVFGTENWTAGGTGSVASVADSAVNTYTGQTASTVTGATGATARWFTAISSVNLPIGSTITGTFSGSVTINSNQLAAVCLNQATSVFASQQNFGVGTAMSSGIQSAGGLQSYYLDADVSAFSSGLTITQASTPVPATVLFTNNTGMSYVVAYEPQSSGTTTTHLATLSASNTWMVDWVGFRSPFPAGGCGALLTLGAGC